MKDKPLVTISTACYNHEKYLPDYFESIISQTYENIELIIIDDASQDNSQKIIENYLPKLKKRFARVVYIPRNKNAGLVKNCNEGLDLARGKYFIGFASDDIMLPTRVEENVEFLENNEEYGMVYSDAYIFYDDIEIKKINFDNLKCFSDQQKLYSGNVMNQLLIYNFIIAPAACIRKNVFGIVGKYNEDYCFEDYDMWLKIAEKFKIGYINKKLSLYRKSINSFSQSKKRKIKILKSIEKIRINHIKKNKYKKKYVNQAITKTLLDILNYNFYDNNVIEFGEYYFKYKKYCIVNNCKFNIKYTIKYILINSKLLYKILINIRKALFIKNMK